MRLIDADVLKQHIDKLPALPDGNFAGNHSALKALINMQPTVQPEIIRCKDCKHNVSSHKCLHPESFFLVTDDDFYCGYAERRTDDKTNKGSSC